MNTNPVYLHKTALQSAINHQVLKEGSSVSVRILEDNGNGKYTASVAGVRIFLYAKNPLQKGNSFVATISIKDGKILLNPKIQDENTKNSIKIISFDSDFFINENGKINAEFFLPLKNLGLPSDNLSKNIFLQFKQLGMKFDSSVMKKIYSISKKFTGKEKRISELLSMIYSKGLDFENEEELIEFLFEYERNFEEKNEINEKNEIFKKDFEIKKIIENFLESILNFENQEKCGKLCVFNHSFSKNGSWIFIPFDIFWGEEKKGLGCIKFFLDNAKNISKMIVCSEYEEKKYNILALFKGKKVSEFKLGIDENQNESKSEFLKNFIKNIKKFIKYPVKVEVFPNELIEGTALFFEKIEKADGIV